jgi:hypothetical protein
VVRSQLGQIVPLNPILKKTFIKIGLVEWLKVKALSSSLEGAVSPAPSLAGASFLSRSLVITGPLTGGDWRF